MPTTLQHAALSAEQLNTIEQDEHAAPFSLEDPAPAVPPKRDHSAVYVTPHGEAVGFDPRNPASLEAFFGNYGHAEMFRKVVLASAREAERAKAQQRGEKVTEARLDDLARTSDKYVDYLTVTLTGRTLRERNVLDSLGR